MGCCSDKEQHEKSQSIQFEGPKTSINQQVEQSSSNIYNNQKEKLLQQKAQIDERIEITLNKANETAQNIYTLLKDHHHCLKNKSVIERLIGNQGFILDCQQKSSELLQDLRENEYYYKLVQNVLIEIKTDTTQNFRDVQPWQFVENIYEIEELQNLITLQNKIENSYNNLKSIEKFLQNIIEFMNKPISIKIEISQDYPRYQFSQQFINQLYDRSWRLRAVEEQYKNFVRVEEGESELKANYSLPMVEMRTLKAICKRYRPVRGDGNCFYTAFAYQFICILLRDYSNIEFVEFFNKMLNLKLRMEIHLESEILELNEAEEHQLLEEFIYRMIKLREIEDVLERINTFTEQFASYDEQNGCLNLSNYALQFHPLQNAVFDFQNLLIWEKECNSNEVIIDSLGQFLNLNIKLAYLEDKKCKLQEYVKDGEHEIILLIKPGHYNVGVNENEKSLINKKLQEELLKVALNLNETLKQYSEEFKNK